MFGFKLTKKKVMGINYEEKHFLEFQDHQGQAPHAKTEFWSLESFPRIVNSLTGVVQMFPFYGFKH